MAIDFKRKILSLVFINLIQIFSVHTSLTCTVANIGSDDDGIRFDLICEHVSSDFNQEDNITVDAANFDTIRSHCKANRIIANILVSIELKNRVLNKANSLVFVNDYLPIECRGRVDSINWNFMNGRRISSELQFYRNDDITGELNFFYFHTQIVRSDGTGLLRACEPIKNITRPIRPTASYTSVNFWRSCVFYENTCDQLFMNANVFHVTFDKYVNSLVKVNKLGFIESQTPEQLGSSVTEVEFKGYRMEISRKTLPRSVFSQMQELTIYGWIDSFDSEIFLHSILYIIIFRSINGAVFWQNNLNWLDYADRRQSKETLTLYFFKEEANPGDHKYLTELDEKGNLFEDTNFCLLYRIKKRNLNIKIFDFEQSKYTDNKQNCEHRWILQNSVCTSYENQIYHNDALSQQCKTLQIKQNDTCDYERIESFCESYKPNKHQEPPIYTIVTQFKMAEFILAIVLGPIINVLGIVANLLVILTFRAVKKSPEFRRNKLTDKNRRMWDYVHFNSVIILALCVIYAIAPLTSCIEYNGIYCSPLFSTSFSLYYNLFILSYLANAFRLMSNTTNFLFVLFRYGVNLDRLAAFRTWKLRKLLPWAFVASFLLSLIKLWVNEQLSLKKIQLTYSYIGEKNNLDSAQTSGFLKAIYLIEAFTNSILFPILNSLFDLKLLFYLKKSRKDQNRKEEVESKITRMIILNGLFSLLFKSPEIIASVIMITFGIQASVLPVCILTSDSLHSLCPILFSISRTFVSLSFLENFIMLYLFKPKFKQELLAMLGCKNPI
nr:G protein-coupled receptor [Proales similis]